MQNKQILEMLDGSWEYIKNYYYSSGKILKYKNYTAFLDNYPLFGIFPCKSMNSSKNRKELLSAILNYKSFEKRLKIAKTLFNYQYQVIYLQKLRIDKGMNENILFMKNKYKYIKGDKNILLKIYGEELVQNLIYTQKINDYLWQGQDINFQAAQSGSYPLYTTEYLGESKLTNFDFMSNHKKIEAQAIFEKFVNKY